MNLAIITSWFIVYRYPVIFLATIFEGPIIMMLAGIMLRLGVVSLLPIFIVLILGDLVGDIFWYSLGYHFAHPITEKYGKFIGITPEILEKTKLSFHNHQIKILFVSKITMGFGFALAILITAGIAKIPFKKYLAVNFFGQSIWTGFLLYIGYSFGNLYTKINKNFRLLSLAAFVVIIFLLLKGIRSYFKKKDLFEKVEKIL